MEPNSSNFLLNVDECLKKCCKDIVAVSGAEEVSEAPPKRIQPDRITVRVSFVFPRFLCPRLVERKFSL